MPDPSSERGSAGRGVDRLLAAAFLGVVVAVYAGIAYLVYVWMV